MSDPKTSAEWLLELGNLHPKLIDLSLSRIQALLERLGHPQDSVAPVVHVAGTNGKGSTVALLRAIYEAAGRRVHTYTSPHLVRFHERIRLAREPGLSSDISEAELLSVLERVTEANAGQPMTFFEITTAAAFLAFSETPADVVLLEVGLGGRLDATNVVKAPALCVLTPISLDHADLLADNVPEIAFEKAGILKPGVDAVIGPQPLDAIPSIERTAERVGAGLIMWGRDFEAFEQNGRLVFQSEDRLIDCRLPELHGRHQLANAGTAIAAVLSVKIGEPPSEVEINRGMADVKWPARMGRLNSGPLSEVVGEGVELWLDGGHNPSAGAALSHYLAELEERAPKPTYLVVGMLRNKDVTGFIAPFESIVREVYTVPIVDNQASFASDELAEIMQEVGMPATPATSLLDALRQINGDDPGEKRILICGSLYLAGNVLAFERQGGI